MRYWLVRLSNDAGKQILEMRDQPTNRCVVKQVDVVDQRSGHSLWRFRDIQREIKLGDAAINDYGREGETGELCWSNDRVLQHEPYLKQRGVTCIAGRVQFFHQLFK